MKIINFEEAKARRNSKDKTAKHLPEVDEGVLELRRQYQEFARFCNRWYGGHVAGKMKTKCGYTKMYKNLHGTSIVCLMRNICIKGSF